MVTRQQSMVGGGLTMYRIRTVRQQWEQRMIELAKVCNKRNNLETTMYGTVLIRTSLILTQHRLTMSRENCTLKCIIFGQAWLTPLDYA